MKQLNQHESFQAHLAIHPNKLFKKVMDSNARTYLEYNKTPTRGIRELYDIAKHRILEGLKRDLANGNRSASLFDALFQFYVDLIQYDFDSLARGIAGQVAVDIKEFEANNPGQLVDKEKLYFLLALVSVASGNTISATTNWELALAEAARRIGNVPSTTSIIANLPVGFTTLLNPVKHRYGSNALLSTVKLRPFVQEYEPLLNSLTGLDALSFLSSGLRNHHVNTMFDAYGLSYEVPRMYGQELINNLSVLNEALLKKVASIKAHYLKPDGSYKKMMIGDMLDKLRHTHPPIFAVLGTSISAPSGLYVDPDLDFSDDNNFNTNYPKLIARIEGGGLGDDALKAHLLFGLHKLRNNVLHDLKPNLVYYNDRDLFVKTIGLLFASISVTKSL